VVKRFEDLAFPLDQRIESNERGTATLAAVRDALLLKLLSGEIDVSALKSLAEEVAS